MKTLMKKILYKFCFKVKCKPNFALTFSEDVFKLLKGRIFDLILSSLRRNLHGLSRFNLARSL